MEKLTLEALVGMSQRMKALANNIDRESPIYKTLSDYLNQEASSIDKIVTIELILSEKEKDDQCSVPSEFILPNDKDSIN